jgi:hypothetical protein
MSKTVNRTSVLCLLAVAVGLFAVSNASYAGPRETAALKPGEYNGRWHGDKVKFIFEKVNEDGTFKGVVRFTKDSNFPDATFVFTGKLEKDGSIEIQRDANDPQKSRAKEPKKEGEHLLWEGYTSGGNLDPKEKYVFELRIPLAK